MVGKMKPGDWIKLLGNATAYAWRHRLRSKQEYSAPYRQSMPLTAQNIVKVHPRVQVRVRARLKFDMRQIGSQITRQIVQANQFIGCP